MDLERLNLNNICEGAAHELFDTEMAALLKNIQDPNTNTAETRKITLEFTFKPSPGMEYMGIEVRSKSKMSSIKPFESGAHLVRDGRKLGAFAPDKRQRSLFDENVTDIEEGKK